MTRLGKNVPKTQGRQVKEQKALFIADDQSPKCVKQTTEWKLQEN